MSEAPVRFWSWRRLFRSARDTAFAFAVGAVLTEAGVPLWVTAVFCGVGMLVCVAVMLDLWLVNRRLDRELDKDWRSRWYARWIR